ncbi:MAG TPA: aspartate carbamoyltransferase regulatory subunit [Candidatus Norongarragalinales archaeon]|nr:aspartate carbamoyltransferase regulatory subunit [Candidatus Norongarragalinales archaeon]
MAEDKENEFLRARKIESGTVIDHIPKGCAMRVLNILGITEEFPSPVSVLMNVPSSHYGHKDMIKVEGRKLEKKELAQIALIAPDATVNTIKNYAVVDKYVVQTPSEIEGVIRCPNPSCITAHEGTARLSVEQPHPLRLRCSFCERVYGEKDVLS